MISDNFWKLLFILMVLGGLVFWYKHNAQKSAFNRAASQLAELIAFDEETKPASDDEAHGRFIKAITKMHELGKAGKDTSLLLNAANEINGLSIDSGQARLITSSLAESLRNAEQLGIFEGQGLWDLRDGLPAPINAGPFAGENIAISYYVPPEIAPGGRFFLGNFLLVPESVAAARKDIELTENLFNVSIQLVNAKIISDGDHKAIKTNYYLQRERNR